MRRRGTIEISAAESTMKVRTDFSVCPATQYLWPRPLETALMITGLSNWGSTNFGKADERSGKVPDCALIVFTVFVGGWGGERDANFHSNARRIASFSTGRRSHSAAPWPWSEAKSTPQNGQDLLQLLKVRSHPWPFCKQPMHLPLAVWGGSKSTKLGSKVEAGTFT